MLFKAAQQYGVRILSCVNVTDDAKKSRLSAVIQYSAVDRLICVREVVGIKMISWWHQDIFLGSFLEGHLKLRKIFIWLGSRLAF